MCLFTLVACRDQQVSMPDDAFAGREIQIGGISDSELEITLPDTKASHIRDAEEVEWLRHSLKNGLDITYGKVADNPTDRKERVAILKLLDSDIDGEPYKKDPITGWAVYSFTYKGQGTPSQGERAIWYDNGEHYFEGLFVPSELRYGDNIDGVANSLQGIKASLTTDQNDPENYTLLEHYLAMPVNSNIHATVGRVKLPFYHRLSRVIAYILIDPEMNADPQNPVTLKGYNNHEVNRGTASEPIWTDNPSTTSIRFCNANVLEGVHDWNEDGNHYLTPKWTSKRKIIPHFVAEEGSEVFVNQNFETKCPDFIMFYDDNSQEYIFPTMEKWMAYYSKYGKEGNDDELKNDKVVRTNYGKVPAYDLIVRPTYSTDNAIMYDERTAEENVLLKADKDNLVKLTNKIDFELTLSNGLIYTKEFVYDLNANQQTVVYLRIARESVDYNASGSDVWIKKLNDDGWYGVDNRLDHSLSKVGSSWQRAYTYGTTVSGDDIVTDGGFYNETTTGEDGTMGQYVTESTWKKKFAQAYKGGECHGDYFILTSDITISAKELQDDFVFTGHLDAHGHSITITETGQQWTEYLATTDYSITPIYSDQSGTEYNLPTLYTKVHHDSNYSDASDLYQIGGEWYLKSTLTYVPEVSHTATQDDVDEGKATNVGDKVIDTPEQYEINSSSVLKQDDYEEYPTATPSMATVMADAYGTYYIYEGDEYKPFTKPTILYKKVDHTSGSALFAGLNGAYSASDGEANVHTEKGVQVPYTDGTTGWRAEVLNVKVVGGLLFPESVYSDSRSGYVTTPSRPVSGNVENCFDSTGRVPDHTPTLARYD